VHDVELWAQRTPPSPSDLEELCSDADAAITLVSDPIDAAFFDACPKVRVVANAGVGYDNVDLAEATRRGIPVGNTPGVVTAATADLTFALILATARRVVEAARAVRAGDWKTWEPDYMLGLELEGSVLGIVGMGQIGRAVARRAGGFGMTVIAHRPVPLEELLEKADVVSLHVPLRADTRGLIGEAELRRMKPTAILVNTARGSIVDQPALRRALDEGWIAAAGLDVVEVEPIPLEDPLLGLENCVVLPHMASATFVTRQRMMAIAVDNILAGLAGAPLPFCVNPEVYGRSSGPIVR
jgi:lactate dehydrogenase-like 2-hydroxyacid dehydrogenase